MTEGQRLAIEQLKDIASAENSPLEVVDILSSEEPGDVTVQVSINCFEYILNKIPEGLPLRGREVFYIVIGPHFPFQIPSVFSKHIRFSGHPHVQWGRYICLYIAPNTEWNPSDGIFGLLERLHHWLEDGAKDQLDPMGGPLHPPVSYITDVSTTCIIPSSNTPNPTNSPWIGYGLLNSINDNCIEIIKWEERSSDLPGPLAATILLSQKMPFEYPKNIADLLLHLIDREVPWHSILLVFGVSAFRRNTTAPLYVVIGSPMRGIRGSNELKQHLAVWEIPPDIAKKLTEVVGIFFDEENLKESGQIAKDEFIKWAAATSIKWCYVKENRPEIIVRRDINTPLSWFRDRTVNLWGCGALGAHVAEYLVRAGVKSLSLNDNGTVTPGILSRQPYYREHLGMSKVEALKKRLNLINPEVQIQSNHCNIISWISNKDVIVDDIEIIIDTTASPIISQLLESRIKTYKNIAISSMIIGHNATNGIVVTRTGHYTGGTHDVFRKAKLIACQKAELKLWLDDFWPETPRNNLFQPEPGCSDATFTGSQADVASLAGIMLNHLAKDFSKNEANGAYSHFVYNNGESGGIPPKISDFFFDADHVIKDINTGYEIRLSEKALKDCFSWFNSSKRINGKKVETGGILFGERSDACKVIWIDEVLGPPSDSTCSEKLFECGTSGVSEANFEKTKRTRGSVKYIGMWHTHPVSEAIPSLKDFSSMLELALISNPPQTHSLLLIFGNIFEQLQIGTYLFRRADLFAAIEKGFLTYNVETQKVIFVKKQRKIALALSGGGSRAIAFHLGCLRALSDKGILDQVDVISSVSGGSVIAAAYAYSDEPFEDFDKKIVKILKKGFVGSIISNWIFSRKFLKYLLSFTLSVPIAIATDLTRLFCSMIWKLMPGSPPDWINRIQPPIRRWAHRSDALKTTLEDLFGEINIKEVKRNKLNIVINACELRSGSAFRFGNKTSACYRYGKIKNNDVTVAEAVAASAAFPAAFPAFDKIIAFIDRNNNEKYQRILLTDGGVFDNLGISAIEPGRSSAHSYHTFSPDYIIACSAGAGIMDTRPIPIWWPTRILRTFDSIYRKFQDQGYKNLFQLEASGKIKGFTLSYLGQIDTSLPYIPPDLVKREDVVNYPTDFSPMSDEDIEKITKRGEQLTRLLLEQYCPEL